MTMENFQNNNNLQFFCSTYLCKKWAKASIPFSQPRVPNDTQINQLKKFIRGMYCNFRILHHFAFTLCIICKKEAFLVL